MVNVTVYNLDEVIVDVILTIEKHRVPIEFLNDILECVKREVELHQIIGRSEVGLTPEAHAEMLEQVGHDLEHIHKLMG